MTKTVSPKATRNTKRTTTRTNPDIELFDLIKSCIALWGKVLPLDAVEEEMKRAGEDTSKITACLIPLDAEIYDLERQIVHFDVSTRQGYTAKLHAIHCVDPEGDEGRDLIVFKLGREAGRLGVGEDPKLHECREAWIDPSWDSNKFYLESAQHRRRYQRREREWRALADADAERVAAS